MSGSLQRKIRVVLALGVQDISRVMFYRVQLRAGWFRRRLPVVPFPFADQSDVALLPAPSVDAATVGSVPFEFFGRHVFELGCPPDWFRNPFNGERLEATDTHWSRIADFGNTIGDIKTVWELSRFGWLVQWAWQRSEHADASERNIDYPINDCLIDWCRKNPVNAGVQWKCAQETSLRAMHMLLAAMLLGAEPRRFEPALRQFLHCHLQRIRPTLHYAMGQANNHGTSEAVALYVIGNVLSESDDAGEQRYGRQCQRLGRYWLEDRIARLFMSDGTFSQYSVTYHRMVLDSLSLAECWRRRIDDAPFSSGFYRKVGGAVRWLSSLVDPSSGDAPNLGPNDGAHIFNLSNTPYRDFRPSVQLAETLFSGASRYCDHPHGLAALFGSAIESSSSLPAGCDIPAEVGADQAAIATLRRHQGMILMRLPTFKFRPNHCDALHVDLWHGGHNLLRDGGSYSYSADPEQHEFFCSTRSHNTVGFDGREQMPRLSRFLLGEWLRPEQLDIASDNSLCASYRDYRGARHCRRIRRTDEGWEVEDDLSGFCDRATLRWRLMPAQWQFGGTSVESNHACISIVTSDNAEITLSNTQESTFYFYKATVPLLTCRISEPAIIKTVIQLHH